MFMRMFLCDTIPLPTNVAYNATQTIPFCTGYNASLAEKTPTRRVATYAPVIDAKPADPSTVYTTMIDDLAGTTASI